MKRMFLASAFANVAGLFEKLAETDLKGKTVSFIPTASTPETVKFYVSAAAEALHKLGLVIDLLDISTVTQEEISHKITRNDYIYISGGNTFFLLHELKRTGADKIISEQILLGKPYIGESAGSIILSRNIEYVTEMDDISAAPALNSYASLALVDFYTLPHYTNPPFKEIAENIFLNYQQKINLLPISNDQAIIVKGAHVEVVSN